MLPDLPERLARMKFVERNRNQIVLATTDGKERAIISLDYFGARKTWLLTAYERPDGNPDGGAARRPGGGVVERTPGSSDPNGVSSGQPAAENVGTSAPADKPSAERIVQAAVRTKDGKTFAAANHAFAAKKAAHAGISIEDLNDTSSTSICHN